MGGNSGDQPKFGFIFWISDLFGSLPDGWPWLVASLLASLLATLAVAGPTCAGRLALVVAAAATSSAASSDREWRRWLGPIGLGARVGQWDGNGDLRRFFLRRYLRPLLATASCDRFLSGACALANSLNCFLLED